MHSTQYIWQIVVKNISDMVHGYLCFTFSKQKKETDFSELQ